MKNAVQGQSFKLDPPFIFFLILHLEVPRETCALSKQSLVMQCTALSAPPSGQVRSRRKTCKTSATHPVILFVCVCLSVCETFTQSGCVSVPQSSCTVSGVIQPAVSPVVYPGLITELQPSLFLVYLLQRRKECCPNRDERWTVSK